MQILPLTCSLFIPLFYLTPFQNKTVEAAAAPMLFYWGLWGAGGKGLFIQYFLKVNRTKETSPSLVWGQSWGREGHTVLNTVFWAIGTKN